MMYTMFSNLVQALIGFLMILGIVLPFILGIMLAGQQCDWRYLFLWFLSPILGSIFYTILDWVSDAL